MMYESAENPYDVGGDHAPNMPENSSLDQIEPPAAKQRPDVIVDPDDPELAKTIIASMSGADRFQLPVNARLVRMELTKYVMQQMYNINFTRSFHGRPPSQHHKSSIVSAWPGSATSLAAAIELADNGELVGYGDLTLDPSLGGAAFATKPQPQTDNHQSAAVADNSSSSTTESSSHTPTKPPDNPSSEESNSTVAHVGRPYFGDFFQAFQNLYWPIHGVICLVICTLGIFANVTNIIVLTRPNMITAVNTILSAMAFSDLIVNISNIPYLIHELSDSSNVTSFYSYEWAVYILLHAHASVTSHTISIWLTCVLATLRYFVVCRSDTANQRNWSVGMAKRTIMGVFLLVPVFCIPNYLSFAITRFEVPESSAMLYKVGFSKLANEGRILKTFHFWMFSCLTKVVPCILLTFFTTVLIKKLLSAREHRLRLATYGQAHYQNHQSIMSESHAMLADTKTGRLHQQNNGQAIGPKLSLPISNASDNLSLMNKSRKKMSDSRIMGSMASSSNELGAPHLLGGSAILGSTSSRLERRGSQSVSKSMIEQAKQEALINGHEETEFSRSTGSTPVPLTNMVTSSPYRDTSRPLSGAQSAELSAPSFPGANQQPPPTGSSAAGSQERKQLVSRIEQDSNQPISTTRVPHELSINTNNSAAAATSNQTNNPPVNPNKGPSQNDTTQDSGKTAASQRLPVHRPPSPRSASTCSGLELYGGKARNSTYTLNGRHLAAEGAKDSGFQGSASCQETNKMIINGESKGSIGELATRGSQSSQTKNSAGRVLSDLGTTTSMSNNLRGRSMGSSTLVPMQMVKIQATQRQLNHNETTTKLLIAVMIVFLICEFPAGILAALCAILGQDFFENVYEPTGILMDLLALINSSVNFILYCFMSTQFRVTFYRVVLHCPAPNTLN